MLSCFIPIVQFFQLVIAAVATVVLFVFAGLTLGVSVVGLILATPLFVVFSPILVPATLATTILAAGLSVFGLLGVMAIALIVLLITHEMGANKPAAKPAEGSEDKPAGAPADKPAGGAAGKPAEAPAGKPAGAPADKPAGGVASKPAEAPAGKPAGDSKPPVLLSWLFSW